MNSRRLDGGSREKGKARAWVRVQCWLNVAIVAALQRINVKFDRSSDQNSFQIVGLFERFLREVIEPRAFLLAERQSLATEKNAGQKNGEKPLHHGLSFF